VDRPHGGTPSRTFRLAMKRAIDVVAAGSALLVLSPVLLLVAIAVLVAQGRPVLFRHTRPGLHGQPFALVKFRTMRPPRPGEIWHATDEERVTRLGRFLRESSLDELPELWNVLRGDLSLVGPRPLLMEYLDAYTPEQHRRHDLRPGLTSWAAVNGRHFLPFADRMALDVWYIDNWSLHLDARILVRTLEAVVRRKDVAVTEDSLGLGFPLPPVPAPAAESAPDRAAPEQPGGSS
jgi:sugar transferase EpsL